MTAQPAYPRTAAPARALQAVLLALLLWCFCAGSAMAAAVVTAVTVNGQSTANVVPGSTVTVTIYVTITNNSRWRMTQIETSPASSLSLCINNTDVSGNGNYSFTFDVVAPPTEGVFSMIFDLHGNANCSNAPLSTRTFPGMLVTDASFPSVLSIVRNLPSPTTASPVTWTVTFDRPVSGVTLGDFGLVATGTVGGTSLSGSYDTTDVYTLETPNTGSGTLGLNVIDNDSIVGPNGRPLGGAGAGNGSFTGQVYVIDRTAPTIPTAGIGSSNAVSALFARLGDTISVAFTTADTSAVQTPTATINGVAASVTGAGSTWVASRSVTAADAEGLVAFKLDVKDVLGNTAISRTTVTNGSSVTIDKTAPVATIACVSLCGAANPVAAGQVSWNVTFSEAVTGVGAANFSFSGSGAGGASIASVSGGPSGYTVVANVTSAGVVGLNFAQNLAAVRDRAGNNPPATTAVAGNSYTIGGCSVAAGGGCTFDAVEPGGAIGSPIFIKRVGAGVTLDILALNGAALNTSSNDTVVATLVVANNSASCGTVEVSDPVSVAFVAANGGRRGVTLVPKRAARDTRVRLVSGGVTACSLDNFALRPDALSIPTSNATADSGGASVSATPVFKAGSAPFTIEVTSVAGYDGTPLLGAARRQVPTGVAGPIAGTFAAADPGTGTATGSFTYGEVGYFRLDSWGVYDDGSFAAVDRAKVPEECFGNGALGTGAAPADPNTANGAGRLGCYFGSAQSTYFGRFIPDHFALSAGGIANRSATATCAASTFTYMGEALTPSFVLTAQNSLNATTVNYTGTLARLTIPTQLSIGVIDDPVAPAARRPLPLCAVAPATPVPPCVKPDVASGTFTNGVSNAISAPLTVLRAAVPVAPYTALKVGVAPIDADGVRIGAYNLDTVNVVAGASDRALVGTTIGRYGRMQIDNAYGSELLNLNVKVAAQYWTGTAWAGNTLDSCTPLGPAGFTVAGQNGGITAANMNAAHLVAGSAMAAGAGRVVLTKPTPAPATKGRALLQSGNNYLPGSGRVTFGVYKAGPVIYVRETY